MPHEATAISVDDAGESGAGLTAFRVVDARVDFAGGGLGAFCIGDARIQGHVSIRGIKKLEVRNFAGEVALWKSGGGVGRGCACERDRLFGHSTDRCGCKVTRRDDCGLQSSLAFDQRADAQPTFLGLLDEFDLLAPHPDLSVVALDEQYVRLAGPGLFRGGECIFDDRFHGLNGICECHPSVPPTVSASTRIVGRPTPTGTPCPSFPQVPTPSSRARS